MNSNKLNKISRTMTKILRHELHNYNHDEEGFVDLDLILKSNVIFKEINIDHIKKIVDADNKSRFSLNFKGNKIFIRANQGHSSGNLNDNNMLALINKQIPGCYHATYSSNLNSIKKNGISRMKRKHIHIAESDEAKSGKRSSCNIKILINMELAINDGIKFYRSENGVILTEGDQNGLLLPKYFLDIINII
tara:strand:- start:3 stop:578 length:576 start_codon:yes stop_codon:yes gene_type:complete